MVKTNYLIENDKKIYSINRIQKKLGFTYISQIEFEQEEKKAEVKALGLEKAEQNNVSSQALKLGMDHKDKILKGFIWPSSIRFIGERVEYGLFAEKDIVEGDYIGEYVGVVRENDRRDLNNYLYEYPVPDYIGRSHVIDASSGGFSRFINHSFNPNLKPLYAFFDGFYHLIFIAIKPVKKGEQLFYDYGKNYWYLRGFPEEI